FDVETGEIAIIPGGIPHREVVQERPEPFENLVISVYNETVSIQLQGHGDGGQPAAVATEYFDAAKFQQLAQYLEEIAEIANTADGEYELGIKGLLLVYLTTLLAAVRKVRLSAPVEKLKISQTKRLVQAHLRDSHLGVE